MLESDVSELVVARSRSNKVGGKFQYHIDEDLVDGLVEHEVIVMTKTSIILGDRAVGGMNHRESVNGIAS